MTPNKVLDDGPIVERIAVDARGVAEMFSVGLRTVRRWDSSGRLPRAFTIGRRKLWRVDDLRQWAADGFPGRDGGGG